MSTKYQTADEVPTEVLAKRLDELSNYVTLGKDSVLRHFTMRVPAECDHDADLVLSGASLRIQELVGEVVDMKCQLDTSTSELSLARARIDVLEGENVELTKALKKIKLTALSAGASHRLLAHIIRLCIDAGVNEKLDELIEESPMGNPATYKNSGA